METRAKEKAKELVGKYKVFEYENGNQFGLSDELARRCAIITVDEIITKLKFYVEQYDHGIFINDLNFYLEVKEELKKL